MNEIICVSKKRSNQSAMSENPSHGGKRTVGFTLVRQPKSGSQEDGLCMRMEIGTTKDSITLTRDTAEGLSSMCSAFLAGEEGDLEECGIRTA